MHISPFSPSLRVFVEGPATDLDPHGNLNPLHYVVRDAESRQELRAWKKDKKINTIAVLYDSGRVSWHAKLSSFYDSRDGRPQPSRIDPFKICIIDESAIDRLVQYQGTLDEIENMKRREGGRAMFSE